MKVVPEEESVQSHKQEREQERKETLLGKRTGRERTGGGGCYSKSPWLCKVAADVVVRTMEKCVGISDCGQIFLEGAKGFQGDSHQIGEYFSKL